jgi:ribosomal protein S27AE
LKKSIKEIEEGENFSCGKCKSPVKFNQKFCSQCGEKQLWALFG